MLCLLNAPIDIEARLKLERERKRERVAPYTLKRDKCVNAKCKQRDMPVELESASRAD